MIELQQLVVLRAVAEAGSLTAAARQLEYTQSTVSYHLARLEEAVGVELLIRQPRGVTLTEAGASLIKHGNAILDRLSAAQAEIDDHCRGRVGRLVVQSFPSALIDLVPRAMQRLLQREAELRVDVVVSARERALAAVAAGAADVAVTFTIGDVEDDDRGLRTTHLLDDPMMAVLSRRHPLSGRQTIALRDLADDRWILSATSGPDALTHHALTAEGIEPDVLVQTGDLQAIHGLVAAGLGVALGPATALRHGRRDLAVRALSDPQLERRIEAATRHSDERDVTASFVELLQNVARTLR